MRGRLVATIVVLVGVTAVVLGAGAYAFVDRELRSQLLRDAGRQATFNLAELVPRAGLAPTADRAAFEATDLPAQFRLRGDVATVADLADGRWVDPASAADLRLADATRGVVERGELAFEWTTLVGQPVLVVAGRPPAGAPTFTFAFDASAVEAALGTLRLALVTGAVVLIGIAVLAASAIASGILRPVRAASEAADAIAAGRLGARVPVRSRDEFGTWAARFNAMAATLEATIERLEAAQAQNRRFVADVSHELRTPITALVAEAALIRPQLDALPPDARRAGELLIADIERLRSLVDDLMELSRFDAAAEQLSTQPVDLGALVRSVVAGRLPDASLDLPRDAVPVATDPRRLDRILGNLLDNAREHAPGSPVEVGLAADAAEALVWVADRGPGVPDEELPRIFERFRKVDPSRRAGSSGLGLAIAAEHAALLGGSLVARPRDGGGLRFELRLPVTGSLPAGDGPVIDDDDGTAR